MVSPVRFRPSALLPSFEYEPRPITVPPAVGAPSTKLADTITMCYLGPAVLQVSRLSERQGSMSKPALSAVRPAAPGRDPLAKIPKSLHTAGSRRWTD